MENNNKKFSSQDLPVCPHDEFCGGCVYQGVSYGDQLANKEGEARGFFSERNIDVGKWDAIEGCPDESRYRYRNKMEYTFGDLVKDGEMTLGMHKKGHFLSIVTVDNCQLVDEDFNKILRFSLEFAKERGYKKYNKRSHRGLMRHLIVRKGIRTKQLLINIVTTGDMAKVKGISGEMDVSREEADDSLQYNCFDEQAFVEGIQALELENEVVGILRTINDDVADAVKCQELRTLYGQTYYEDEILGLKFKVSAFSFFQTNVEAAERLYRQAIDLIDGLEGKKVFDLYCGTGTISQLMALRAAEVVGIELSEEAVAAAKENAKLNNLDNCRFIAGDVYKVLETMDYLPDVIVVDPPRMGMTEKAVDKIMSYGVEQIIYVSCNPKTLAMNLEQFRQGGYEVLYSKPFDNFPFTKHVESVVLMTRVAHTK